MIFVVVIVGIDERVKITAHQIATGLHKTKKFFGHVLGRIIAKV